jgi:hypothetical protein
MDSGLRQRERARQRRQPAGRAGTRAPRPTPDTPKRREGERPSLWSIIGDTVHGLLFLGLAAASVVYFGHSFDVLAAVVAALSILSLKEAWTGLQTYRGKPPSGK